MNKTILLALFGIFSICRVSLSASDQSPKQEIRYQCFICESDRPIPHDYSKISDRSEIQVINTPVVTAKVDHQVCVEVTRQLPPEYVKGFKPIQLVKIGISIFLKGTLDQDKINLIGRTQVVDVADQATTENLSFSTLSKDIYFSKNVKSGEDVWFDVNLPFQKSKYLTIRIIPTLVSSNFP